MSFVPLPFELALAFPVHPFWPTSNELEVVGEALSSVKKTSVCIKPLEPVIVLLEYDLRSCVTSFVE